MFESKYHDDMPLLVYKYIDERSGNLTEIKTKGKYYKGEFCPEEYEIGTTLPTVWDLAKILKITRQQVYIWEKKYPEFRDAMIEYRELQKYYLIQNTLRGFYKEGFSIFVMKNITGWTDAPKVKVDTKSLSDEELVKYAKIALKLMSPDNEN